MAVEKRTLRLNTRGDTDILNITPQIAREVEASGISSGVVTLFISGSTAGITTVEYESGLIQDLRESWERLIPKGIGYYHDRQLGEGNGYAHVRASLLGPSLSIPFVQRKLLLGAWQQVVLIDFDNRPRSREVVLQIVGEP